MELWKEAYRAEVGRDADKDLVARSDEVTAWRVGWQAAYRARESWAVELAREIGGYDDRRSAA